MTKQSILKTKWISSFQKACLPKWEGAKYAGDGRPSCFTTSYKNVKLNLKIFSSFKPTLVIRRGHSSG